MKKIELLAPAGNMDNLIAAVMAGADAVYLGGSNFGARAFSKNFSNDEIVKAIEYCHLYGVKVYVTINTLVYENEVNEFMEYVDFLHKNNVDAVLIQDLGMLDLVRKTYPNLEIHSSTQMHIHNLDGALLMQKLGIKRVVLARETSIEDIKNIKNNSNIELEVFVHGALCISYSGECLMSSLIGGRSGNRGTCAGSCRLKYDVIDENGTKLNKEDYPLSTKELNTLEYINELIEANVSSLKIEGRMKSKEYVYKVVSLYRNAIDSYYKNKKIIINEEDIIKLRKLFNRGYTKGFIFNEENNNIINSYRPNHLGVKIGKVLDYKNNIATIKLFDDLKIGSGLRIIGDVDVGVSVNEFYVNNKLVKEAKNGSIITIRVNDKVKINSDVLVTLDKNVYDEIDEEINKLKRKVLINAKIIARSNENLSLYVTDGVNEVSIVGSKCIKSINKPTTKEEIINKLNKLGDSVYKYDKLEIELDDNIFIPLKEINELRRNMIQRLNEKRLYKTNYLKSTYNISVPNFKKERLLTVFIEDDSIDTSMYDVVYGKDIKKIPRVVKFYEKYNDKEYLVGEVGAFNKFNSVYTDFSFNVVNSYAVAFLHSMGAKRITLSYELNFNQIKEIIDNYHLRYKTHPNLELIVSAYEEVMVCKFSLKEYYNNENIRLRDRFKNIYKLKFKDDLMYIYNYKKRNDYNTSYYDIGVNALRYNLDI